MSDAFTFTQFTSLQETVFGAFYSLLNKQQSMSASDASTVGLLMTGTRSIFEIIQIFPVLTASASLTCVGSTAECVFGILSSPSVNFGILFYDYIGAVVSLAFIFAFIFGISGFILYKKKRSSSNKIFEQFIHSWLIFTVSYLFVDHLVIWMSQFSCSTSIFNVEDDSCGSTSVKYALSIVGGITIVCLLAFSHLITTFSSSPQFHIKSSSQSTMPPILSGSIEGKVSNPFPHIIFLWTKMCLCVLFVIMYSFPSKQYLQIPLRAVNLILLVGVFTSHILMAPLVCSAENRIEAAKLGAFLGISIVSFIHACGIDDMNMLWYCVGAVFLGCIGFAIAPWRLTNLSKIARVDLNTMSGCFDPKYLDEMIALHWEDLLLNSNTQQINGLGLIPSSSSNGNPNSASQSNQKDYHNYQTSNSKNGGGLNNRESNLIDSAHQGSNLIARNNKNGGFDSTTNSPTRSYLSANNYQQISSNAAPVPYKDDNLNLVPMKNSTNNHSINSTSFPVLPASNSSPRGAAISNALIPVDSDVPYNDQQQHQFHVTQDLSSSKSRLLSYLDSHNFSELKRKLRFSSDIELAIRGVLMEWHEMSFPQKELGKAAIVQLFVALMQQVHVDADTYLWFAVICLQVLQSPTSSLRAIRLAAEATTSWKILYMCYCLQKTAESVRANDNMRHRRRDGVTDQAAYRRWASTAQLYHEKAINSVKKFFRSFGHDGRGVRSRDLKTTIERRNLLKTAMNTLFSAEEAYRSLKNRFPHVQEAQLMSAMFRLQFFPEEALMERNKEASTEGSMSSLGGGATETPKDSAINQIKNNVKRAFSLVRWATLLSLVVIAAVIVVFTTVNITQLSDISTTLKEVEQIANFFVHVPRSCLTMRRFMYGSRVLQLNIFDVVSPFTDIIVDEVETNKQSASLSNIDTQCTQALGALSLLRGCGYTFLDGSGSTYLSKADDNTVSAATMPYSDFQLNTDTDTSIWYTQVVNMMNQGSLNSGEFFTYYFAESKIHAIPIVFDRELKGFVILDCDFTDDDSSYYFWINRTGPMIQTTSDMYEYFMQVILKRKINASIEATHTKLFGVQVFNLDAEPTLTYMPFIQTIPMIFNNFREVYNAVLRIHRFEDGSKLIGYYNYNEFCSDDIMDEIEATINTVVEYIHDTISTSTNIVIACACAALACVLIGVCLTVRLVQVFLSGFDRVDGSSMGLVLFSDLPRSEIKRLTKCVSNLKLDRGILDPDDEESFTVNLVRAVQKHRMLSSRNSSSASSARSFSNIQGSQRSFNFDDINTDKNKSLEKSSSKLLNDDDDDDLPKIPMTTVKLSTEPKQSLGYNNTDEAFSGVHSPNNHSNNNKKTKLKPSIMENKELHYNSRLLSSSKPIESSYLSSNRRPSSMSSSAHYESQIPSESPIRSAPNLLFDPMILDNNTERQENLIIGNEKGPSTIINKRINVDNSANVNKRFEDNDLLSDSEFGQQNSEKNLFMNDDKSSISSNEGNVDDENSVNQNRHHVKSVRPHDDAFSSNSSSDDYEETKGERGNTVKKNKEKKIIVKGDNSKSKNKASNDYPNNMSEGRRVQITEQQVFEFRDETLSTSTSRSRRPRGSCNDCSTYGFTGFLRRRLTTTFVSVWLCVGCFVIAFLIIGINSLSQFREFYDEVANVNHSRYLNYIFITESPDLVHAGDTELSFRTETSSFYVNRFLTSLNDAQTTLLDTLNKPNSKGTTVGRRFEPRADLLFQPTCLSANNDCATRETVYEGQSEMELGLYRALLYLYAHAHQMYEVYSVTPATVISMSDKDQWWLYDALLQDIANGLDLLRATFIDEADEMIDTETLKQWLMLVGAMLTIVLSEVWVELTLQGQKKELRNSVSLMRMLPSRILFDYRVLEKHFGIKSEDDLTTIIDTTHSSDNNNYLN